MVAIPFAANESPPAVTVPSFKIEHSAQSGGGLGSGLLDTVTGGASDDPWQSHVVDLNFTVGRAPRVDTLEITLLETENAPEIAIDDELSLQLGVADAMETVFSGKIRYIEWSANGNKKISVTNDSFLLARGFKNLSSEQQSAGDIVENLCGELGVSTGNVESGNDYPFYVIDDRQSLYQHCFDLAQQSGFVCYFSADGEFQFKALTSPDNTYDFHYGADIIELVHTQRSSLTDGVTVYGSGAAPSQGSDAAFWLSKESQVKTEVSGDSTAFSTKRALRDIAGAEAYANSLAEKSSRLDWIEITVQGVPPFHMGDAINVSDTPNAQADGEYFIFSFNQHFSLSEGYITQASAYKSSSGGGLGGLF